MAVGVPTHEYPELRVLGAFRFSSPEADLPASAPGTQRLLALLGVSNRALPRTNISRTLWPDASAERATSRLRAALTHSVLLQEGAILATPVELELADDVVVDIRESRALAHRLLDPNQELTAQDSGSAALATLSSDLLPDWYDDWVLVEAEEWRQLRLHALETLAARLLKAERFGAATAAALSVVRAEPLRESARAAVIRVHLAIGNQADALGEFARYRALLQTELGLAPTASLRELVSDVTVSRPGLPDASDSGRSFRAFDANADARPAARRFVHDAIAGHAGMAPEFAALSDAAAMLTAELVSDAVVHHATEVHVLALCMADRVRVEVYDTGRSLHVARDEAPDAHIIRLQMLDELADRWSMEYVGTGQLNWFELRLDRSAPRTAARDPRQRSDDDSGRGHPSKTGRAISWLRQGSLNN